MSIVFYWTVLLNSKVWLAKHFTRVNTTEFMRINIIFVRRNCIVNFAHFRFTPDYKIGNAIRIKNSSLCDTLCDKNQLNAT